ncbi:hypothetical protein HDU93_002718 [Gonapodya sp. JEL0774]|nr:hypothetical protein HDU93_002718 [Gonapodya sp. JEL0774]
MAKRNVKREPFKSDLSQWEDLGELEEDGMMYASGKGKEQEVEVPSSTAKWKRTHYSRARAAPQRYGFTSPPTIAVKFKQPARRNRNQSPKDVEIKPRKATPTVRQKRSQPKDNRKETPPEPDLSDECEIPNWSEWESLGEWEESDARSARAVDGMELEVLPVVWVPQKDPLRLPHIKYSTLVQHSRTKVNQKKDSAVLNNMDRSNITLQIDKTVTLSDGHLLGQHKSNVVPPEERPYWRMALRTVRYRPKGKADKALYLGGWGKYAQRFRPTRDTRILSRTHQSIRWSKVNGKHVLLVAGRSSLYAGNLSLSFDRRHYKRQIKYNKALQDDVKKRLRGKDKSTWRMPGKSHTTCGIITGDVERASVDQNHQGHTDPRDYPKDRTVCIFSGKDCQDCENKGHVLSTLIPEPDGTNTLHHFRAAPGDAILLASAALPHMLWSQCESCVEGFATFVHFTHTEDHRAAKEAYEKRYAKQTPEEEAQARAEFNKFGKRRGRQSREKKKVREKTEKNRKRKRSKKDRALVKKRKLEELQVTSEMAG